MAKKRKLFGFILVCILMLATSLCMANVKKETTDCKNTKPIKSRSVAKHDVSKKVHKLKNAGYKLLEQNRTKEALPLFLQAQKLDPCDNESNMQIAYMYDELGDSKKAYNEFYKVAATNDPKFKQQAEESLINLANYHYKLLPKPWFTDIYFAPEYSGYYDDLIYPLRWRFGVAYGKNEELEIYASVRYDRDTRSGMVNAFPDIYNDNIFVPAIGVRYQFSQIFPLAAYAEWGMAHDFVDPEKPNWEEDTRVGLDFYKDWGAQPEYSLKAKWQLKPMGDLYGDVAYYTIYDDDVIGQVRLRQGFQFFTCRNTSFGLYLKGDYFFDSKRLYYNNMIKYGPGIVFTPFNRINLQFRLEPTWVSYIKVDSDEPNPHSSHYYDTIALMEFYIRF